MEPGDGFTLDGIKPKVLLGEAKAPWSNGAYLAVSLVYVGGLPDHADLALPLLRQLSMPATFFIDPLTMLDEVRRWEAIRTTEHEVALAPFMNAQPTGFLPSWTQGALATKSAQPSDSVVKFLESVRGACTILGRLYTAIRPTSHRLSNESSITW